MVVVVVMSVTVAIALAAGWLRGGRLSNLAAVRLHAGPLAICAAAAQLGLVSAARMEVPSAFVAVLLATSLLAALSFGWRNRHLPGMGLVLLGLSANAAVMAVNGGMPVSAEALQVAGGATRVTGGKHLLLAPGTPLAPLADVLALPSLATVISVGDVAVAAGVVLMVSSLMRSPPARGRPGGRGELLQHGRRGRGSAAQPTDRRA